MGTDPFVLTTRFDGTYSFTNLAPGRFKLLALDPGVTNARDLRDHLKDYADIIDSVEIHPGQSITRDLRRHAISK